MAFGAEETPRRYRSKELPVAVHEMRDADHRRLRLPGTRACMAGQAFVAVDVDLVAFGGVWDDRWLFGIIAGFLFRGVAQRRYWRRRSVFVERGRPAQARTDGLRHQRRRS